MESELMKLGFAPRQIVEVIVSTYDENKTPDAAPMGVTSRGGRLIIRPYTTTQTYLNLRGRRCGVVNLTGDPELFYRTAIKESNKGGQVPAEWFIGAETVDAPRLKGVEAYLEVSVVDQSPVASDRAEFVCEVVRLNVMGAHPKAYSRAAFALIESVIHATRVKEYLASGRVGDAEQLLSLIDHYRTLVERVAPGSRYALVMADLLKRVESWRTKP
jgi:hypothetical protein